MILCNTVLEIEPLIDKELLGGDHLDLPARGDGGVFYRDELGLIVENVEFPVFS